MIPEDLQEYLGKRLDGVEAIEVVYGDLTLTVDADRYRAAAELCRTDHRLDFDFFDTLFGIDAREDGFDVVTVLYSVEHRHRVILKHRCAGGREQPVAPTLTHLWRGANWHERETWDMFGIEFEGHPGLAPRILCAENFEGWPLRKDFYLASRAAKPWPGVKEPAETDEEGNVVEKVPMIGEAPGPTVLDELMSEQARKVNARQPDLAAHEAEALEEGAPPSASSEVKEQVDDAATKAKEKAERARKKAAEARARKAAERADEAPPVTTPQEDTTEAPKDADAAPEPEAGGPPAAPTEDTREAEPIRDPDAASRPESDLETGMHETVDEVAGGADRAEGEGARTAREQRSSDPDDAEAEADKDEEGGA